MSTSTIPVSLKSADINRFAVRAQQLQNVKPAIAYWCNYWIVQVIISKGLHNADDQALQYTTKLMDSLEEVKAAYANDDTITDDIAGKAFVEQFALDTFGRAENAMTANKASAQTAQTFQAAATFLELLAIWAPLDAEMQQKIKFAKFHSLRILKAIKAGEDPNLTNPQRDQSEAAEKTAALPPLDPNDPEVLALGGASRSSRQASVTEVTDEADANQARLATQSLANESIHPSRAPSVPPQGNSIPGSGKVSPLARDAVNFYSGNNADVSPISPERRVSAGGNYFPRMPSPGLAAALPETPPILPSAPDSLDIGIGLPSAPSVPAGDDGPPASLPPAPGDARDASSADLLSGPQPGVPRTPLDSFQAPPSPGQPSLPSISASTHPTFPLGTGPPPGPTGTMANAHHIPPTSNAPNGTYAAPQRQPEAPVPDPVIDEEAMMKAQKHARWAISALNFEDVPTAITEFRRALETLGAR